MVSGYGKEQRLPSRELAREQVLSGRPPGSRTGMLPENVAAQRAAGNGVKPAATRAAAPFPERPDVAMLESLPNLDALLDRLTDAVIGVDRGLALTYVNRQAIKMLRLDEADLLGRSLKSVATQFPTACEHVEQYAQRPQPAPAVCEDHMADTDQWMQTTVSSIPSGVMLQMRDITSDRRDRELAQEEVTERRTAERRLRAQTEQLQKVIRATNDGIFVHDHRTGDLSISPRALQILGYPETARLSPNDWLARIHPDDLPVFEEAIAEHLATKSGSYTSELRVRRRDGRLRWVHIRGAAIHDPSGELMYTLAAMSDITVRKQEEESRHLASETSALLMSALEPTEALRSITGLLVPAFADAAYFDLAGDGAGVLHRAAWAHGGSRSAPLIEEALHLIPASATTWHPITHVIRSAEPLLVSDDSPGSPPEHRDDALQLLRHAGLSSILCVPLIARGVVLGVFTVCRTRSTGSFSDVDIATATDLAHRVGLALENARLFQAAQRDIARRKRKNEELSTAYQKEHKIAGMLQHTLSTRPPADATGTLAVDMIYRAAKDEAEVGGDYFDVFPAGDGRIAVVVGDVSGKGLEAASRTAEVKFTLRAFVRQGGDPGQILSRLSAYLADPPVFASARSEYFVALTLLLADMETGEVTAAVAGSEPPLIVRRNGDMEGLYANGLPAGVDAGAEYNVASGRLEPGDFLVLATDGITEARSGGANFLGFDGLMRLAYAARNQRTLKGIGEKILADTIAFAGGHLHDDVCILLLGRRESPPIATASSPQ